MPGQLSAPGRGYRRLAIGTNFDRLVTIDATGRTLRGVVITGSNVRILGGRIEATAGHDGFAGAGYGLWLRGAARVTVANTIFAHCNRGIVTDAAERVTIARCGFQLGQDGIIASGGAAITIRDNFFGAVAMRPTRCVVPGKPDQMGLSRAACEAIGGSWTDGWHQDAIQFRNGIDGLTIAGNMIEGTQQGIGQMDGAGDAPVRNVTITGNTVRVTGFHSISTGRVTGRLTITGNDVASLLPGRRATIKWTPAEVTQVCGNTGQRANDPGCAACPY